MSDTFYVTETGKPPNIKLLIALLAIIVALLTTFLQGYNVIIHSLCFGTFLFLMYSSFITKEPREASFLYFSLRIWVLIVITLYLGMLSGLLYSYVRASEAAEFVKSVGEALISLRSPIMIFLFNLPKGLLGAIPYLGPFIIGVAGGNSGFIMGSAVYNIYFSGEKFRAIIASLVAFHPYGFLELFSYSTFITASLYFKEKMWGHALKLVGLAIILLLIAAYVEFWELKFFR